jgi:hypothetical protein
MRIIIAAAAIALTATAAPAQTKINCFGFLFFFQCELPGKTTTVVCPPLIEWPTDLQRRAALELGAMPPGAALRSLVPLAIEQRNVIRRCRTSNTGQ